MIFLSCLVEDLERDAILFVAILTRSLAIGLN